MSFAELNRQLAKDVVAAFRHDKTLYHRDGENWKPFDAIREPVDADMVQTAGRKIRFERVGFQVTGETWQAMNAAMQAGENRFIFERVSETMLYVYEIDKNRPCDELTGDRHAIRINTVFTGEKPVDDDFTGRILRETP